MDFRVYFLLLPWVVPRTLRSSCMDLLIYLLFHSTMSSEDCSKSGKYHHTRASMVRLATKRTYWPTPARFLLPDLLDYRTFARTAPLGHSRYKCPLPNAWNEKCTDMQLHTINMQTLKAQLEAAPTNCNAMLIAWKVEQHSACKLHKLSMENTLKLLCKCSDPLKNVNAKLHGLTHGLSIAGH